VHHRAKKKNDPQHKNQYTITSHPPDLLYIISDMTPQEAQAALWNLLTTTLSKATNTQVNTNAAALIQWVVDHPELLPVLDGGVNLKLTTINRKNLSPPFLR
jgi:hypothetical protein